MHTYNSKPTVKLYFLRALLLLVVYTVCALPSAFSQDFKMRWATPLPQGNNLNAVHFINAHEGVTVGDRGTIMLTDDGSESWSIISSGVTANLKDIYFVDSSTGYAVGDEGVILQTTDSGKTWGKLLSSTDKDLYKVIFLSPTTGFAFGERGTILKTDDGGKKWLTKSTSVTKTLTSAYFFDEEVGFVVGQNGTLAKTLDGGETWAETNVTPQNPSRDMLKDISFADEDHGVITAQSSKVYTTEDGGKTWFLKTRIGRGDICSIAFINENEGYIVGKAGSILKTENGGNSWITVKNSEKSTLNDIFFVSSTAYAVGEAGRVFKSPDMGKTWTMITQGIASNFRGLAYPNGTDGILLTDIGEIYKVDATCSNPIKVTGLYKGGFTNSFRKLYFFNESLGFALTSMNQKIYRTKDGGTTWETLELDERGFVDIAFASETTGYIISAGGQLSKTEDGGETWRNVPTGISSDVGTISSLALAGNAIYASGKKGLMIKSVDGGATWETLVTGTQNDFTDVEFVNENLGFVTTYKYNKPSQIYKTADGGASWSAYNKELVQNIHELKFIDENNGYAISYEGVFCSTKDGGETWTVEESISGQPLQAIHMFDANNGLVAGNLGAILQISTGAMASATTQTAPANVTPVGKDGNDVAEGESAEPAAIQPYNGPVELNGTSFDVKNALPTSSTGVFTASIGANTSITVGSNEITLKENTDITYHKESKYVQKAVVTGTNEVTTANGTFKLLDNSVVELTPNSVRSAALAESATIKTLSGDITCAAGLIPSRSDITFDAYGNLVSAKLAKDHTFNLADQDMVFAEGSEVTLAAGNLQKVSLSKDITIAVAGQSIVAAGDGSTKTSMVFKARTGELESFRVGAGQSVEIDGQKIPLKEDSDVDLDNGEIEKVRIGEEMEVKFYKKGKEQLKVAKPGRKLVIKDGKIVKISLL